MQLQVHFPDLTELGNLHDKQIPGEERNYGEKRSLEECTKEALTKVKTELVFAHIGRDYFGTALPSLKATGFEQITCALNWHHLHRGDHPITLWMKKFPEQNAPQTCNPKRVRIEPGFDLAGENVVFSFGCGGRIIDGLSPNLKLVSPKPLTLLRISKTQFVDELWVKWMTATNFKQVQQTTLARYYVNGWPATTYKEDFERAFWQGWEARQASVREPRKKKVPALVPVAAF